MNPYVFEVYCDVCGGPGVATPRTAAAQWIVGNVIRHTDPRVCADYLKKKKRELDKRETELKKQEQES